MRYTPLQNVRRKYIIYTNNIKYKAFQKVSMTMEKQYKTYDDLPLMLSVLDVASVLGISRAGAYELVKSDGFPSLTIGSRIIVPKEDFILWIKQKVSEK